MILPQRLSKIIDNVGSQRGATGPIIDDLSHHGYTNRTRVAAGRGLRNRTEEIRIREHNNGRHREKLACYQQHRNCIAARKRERRDRRAATTLRNGRAAATRKATKKTKNMKERGEDHGRGGGEKEADEDKKQEEERDLLPQVGTKISSAVTRMAWQ